MPQKIKKQIKRSMPWLMIISLIMSTMSVGLVFNLDVKIYQTLDKKFNLEFSRPEANADTATTTVKVLNNPPAWVGNAAESPSSTSTSPVNVGAGISFTGRGNDAEGNDFYLAICGTNAITASTTGGPPACAAGQTMCTSTITTNNTVATCSYAVADPGAETDQWYAFLCDNHASEASCTEIADQGAAPGTGDDSSPFYVNHAPVFTAVNTTDDNKDPGGTFTITASVIDSDVARGAETMVVNICNTNSWATSTGCANRTLCTATSTSPDIDCSFATSTPAIDGAWTYYAFVRDFFFMPATGNSQTDNYNVNNVAPEVSGVIVHSGVDITLNIKNAAEVLATTSSVSVQDNNGCTDITYATGTIFWEGATASSSCAADDNNCYQIGAVNCVATAGSCQDTWDSAMTYTCSTTLAYHAIPTDNSDDNPASTTKWLGAITAFDEALHGTGTSTSGVEVKTSTALEVTELSINYGQVRSGYSTGSSTATTTIINFGNAPLDSLVSGVNMTKGVDNILVYNQQYSLVYQFDWGTGFGLTSTSTPEANIVVPRPTSQTDVNDYVYWGINIPAGTVSGDYEGLNTFTAILNSTGTWNIP